MHTGHDTTQLACRQPLAGPAHGIQHIAMSPTRHQRFEYYGSKLGMYSATKPYIDEMEEGQKISLKAF